MLNKELFTPENRRRLSFGPKKSKNKKFGKKKLFDSFFGHTHVFFWTRMNDRSDREHPYQKYLVNFRKFS